MKKVTAASAALALLLCACESGSGSDRPDQAWYGQIRNSCGPTDAWAVTLGIDTAAYPDCADPYPAEMLRLDAGVRDLDSVEAGRVFDTVLSPCPDKCAITRFIRVEIERISAEGVQAWIRMEDSLIGGAIQVREGRTLLERCRERPVCG